MKHIVLTAFALLSLTQTANAEYRDPKAEDFLGTYDGVVATSPTTACVVSFLADAADATKVRAYAIAARNGRKRSQSAGPVPIERSELERVAYQVVDDRGLQGNTIRYDASQPHWMYTIDLLIRLAEPTAILTQVRFNDFDGDVVDCANLVKRTR